jgi:hypothetical protein
MLHVNYIESDKLNLNHTWIKLNLNICCFIEVHLSKFQFDSQKLSPERLG